MEPDGVKLSMMVRFPVEAMYHEHLSVFFFQHSQQAVFVSHTVGNREQSGGFVDRYYVVVLIEYGERRF